MIVADTVVSGARIVTMDTNNRVLENAAIAVKDDRIIAVGPNQEVRDTHQTNNLVDGRRFVITPGLINGHIHITGDPLTRAWLPEHKGDDFEDELLRWVLPRFNNHEPEDERISAQLAAAKMLTTGTTMFIEAGTVNHLDQVVAGAAATGIRGRVGTWVEGADGDNPAQAIDRAIGALEKSISSFPDDGARVVAWPILVGHSTNPKEVWSAAKSLADQNGLFVAAHMSPYEDDAEWYLAQHGRRPIEYLADIGVLGSNVFLTHVVHIDANELDLLAGSGTNVVLCPMASLRGGFGLGKVGRFPDMIRKGINVLVGSDGFDQDLLRLNQIFAGVFVDVERDRTLFTSESMLHTLTIGAASALGLGAEIGSLEVGKKADFVCHDIDRPEWQPLQNILHQLAWLADGRSVHSVWVDGVRVVEDYKLTLVDESDLFARAAQASDGIMRRANLPLGPDGA